MIEVRIYECEPFQPAREFAVVTIDSNGVLITAADPFAQRIKEIRLIDPKTDEQLTAAVPPRTVGAAATKRLAHPIHAGDRHARRAGVRHTQPQPLPRPRAPHPPLASSRLAARRWGEEAPAVGRPPSPCVPQNGMSSSGGAGSKSATSAGLSPLRGAARNSTRPTTRIAARLPWSVSHSS